MITLKTDRELKYAIGVDLGGTYIKAGIVDSNGKVFNDYKIESFADKGPKRVIEQINTAIEHLLKPGKKEITGIGIGAPGIVYKGQVKYPPNFKNWEVVELENIVSKKFGLNVNIDNDANCAGMAELLFGYGRKYKFFVLLTLGTGVGGAIIIDGKLYRGEYNGAGEFGMASINFNGPECLGGTQGAVEAYIGRNYFFENEKELISKLGKKIDFNNIAKQAEKENKNAIKLMKHYGFYLGLGITNFFNLMDIRTCILTGGVSNLYPYFIKELKKTIKERAIKTIKEEFRVLRSEIQNHTGIIGAAALIHESE